MYRMWKCTSLRPVSYRMHEPINYSFLLISESNQRLHHPNAKYEKTLSSKERMWGKEKMWRKYTRQNPRAKEVLRRQKKKENRVNFISIL